MVDVNIGSPLWKLSVLMLAVSALACVSADQLPVEVTDGWKQIATDEDGLPYNSLGSPMFVVPRPTDKQAIHLMCKFIQEKPWLPNVEREDNDDISPNWDRLYASRSVDVAECCQKEGNDQELCIETLRQTTVDQYCFFVANSPQKTKLGLNDPCCEETGVARVQCMDQARYGFDVDIHDSDRTMELMRAPLLFGLLKALKIKKNPPPYDNNFCMWAKKQPYVDITFEKATLLVMDPMRDHAVDTQKFISCCYQSSDEPTIDKCLTDVRQKVLDDFCWRKAAMKQGLPLINPSLLEDLPRGMKALLEYAGYIPDHPCCKRSNTNRYSCFTQELFGYKPSRDPYDHTDEIAQYKEKFHFLASKIKTEKSYGKDVGCPYWKGGKVVPEPMGEVELLFPPESPAEGLPEPQEEIESLSPQESTAKVSEVDDDCLECMCAVLSNGCNMPDPVCVDTYGGEICGPWAITQPYWEDAGKPWGDFHACVQWWDCNKKAVRGYLAKYVTDPNATCETYARVHVGGPSGAKQDWTLGYWTKVKQCLNPPTGAPDLA